MMESRSAVLSQSLTHTGSVCVIPDRGMAGKRIALYKKRNESPKFRDILRAVSIVVLSKVLVVIYSFPVT